MACVIVGGGAAGLQAALASRGDWPDQPVILIDVEQEIGYYRSLLPQFMAGRLEEDRLFFWRKGEDPLLVIRTGKKVSRLDRENQKVELEDGEKIEYERLILAHGGSPTMPGVVGKTTCKGKFPVRDLTTARMIRQWLPEHQEVLILGGSLVAVKTAVHLRSAGFKVSLLIRRDHTLLRVLSPRAAQMVDDHLCRMGIHLLFNGVVEEIRVRDGAVDAVKAGKEWLPCSTLLVAAGATPDSAFLEDSGLLENGELVVSSALQTLDRKIFAAGDVAVLSAGEGKKINPATWPHAVSQGKLAAQNLYRSVPNPLHTLTGVNCMDLHGLSLVVLGSPVSGAEVMTYSRTSEGVLRELFLLEGRIVGGALVGDISGAGPLYAMMNCKREVDQRMDHLLGSGGGILSHLLDSLGQRRQAFILSSQELRI